MHKCRIVTVGSDPRVEPVTGWSFNGEGHPDSVGSEYDKNLVLQRLGGWTKEELIEIYDFDNEPKS